MVLVSLMRLDKARVTPPTDTKLDGVGDRPDGCAAIQRDLEMLESCRLTGWKAAQQRRPLWFCVIMSQQCTLTVKGAHTNLGCIRKSVESRPKEVILPLCSALVRAQLDCWVQFSPPQCEKDTDILKQVQQRVTKVIMGQEHFSDEERLRNLGLVSLGRVSFSGDLINT